MQSSLKAERKIIAVLWKEHWTDQYDTKNVLVSFALDKQLERLNCCSGDQVGTNSPPSAWLGVHS